MPDERDFVNLEREDRELIAVRCEVFDGWVFVNQNLDAQPLLEFLAPIPEEMAQFQGERLRTVAQTAGEALSSRKGSMHPGWWRRRDGYR